MILTRKGITIFKESTLEIISKLREKRGGTNHMEKYRQLDKNIDKFLDITQRKIIEKECNCKIPDQCKELLEEDLGLKLEEIYDELEICMELIDNKNIYNLLETGIEEMDKIISILEILGENPTKFWKEDKIYHKLEILNPNLKIFTAKIEASNEEIKEFEMHIEDLKKLGVIRKSENPHRNTAFIVIKHSEIARGKNRMVINYKRLNDNTKENSYDIQDKTN